MAAAWVKDFGGAKGLVADPQWSALEPYADALWDDGYGFSAIELDEVWDRDRMIGILQDWTWCGPPENEPLWMMDTPENDDDDDE